MPDPGGVIPALVLAAGQSTRMGRNKLLVELQGKPMLHWAIESLLGALPEIIVITGHEAPFVEASCSEFLPRVRFVHNPGFARGRTSSIKAGLASIPGDAKGILIMPGDVPFVNPELILQLVSAFNQKELITFPLVDGRKGHPVIFPKSAFHLLRELEGDQTLHDYLLANPDQTNSVACSDPGCIRDFDRLEDIDKLTRGE